MQELAFWTKVAARPDSRNEARTLKATRDKALAREMRQSQFIAKNPRLIGRMAMDGEDAHSVSAIHT